MSLVLILAWVGASAESWIRARAGAERPAHVSFLGLLLASGFLAVFLAVFTYAHEARSEIAKYVALDYSVAADIAWVGPEWLWEAVLNAWLLSVLKQPVILLALAVLWLFPLAAWLRRRKQASDPPWAFLEEGGRLHAQLLGKPSIEAWVIGLLAGVACLCAIIERVRQILPGAGLRVGLRAGFAPETREQLGFGFAFSYWLFLIAIGSQTLAAMVTAARVRELPIVHALAAAFTTGVIATAGIAGLPSVASCVDPIALRSSPCDWYVDAAGTWFDFRLVVAEGALAALAGGLVVLGVRAVLERRRVPVPPTPADLPGRNS